MSGLLDAYEVTFACPKCGREFTKTLGGIKASPDHLCSCGTTTTIEFDARQFDGQVADLERLLARYKLKAKPFHK